MKKDNPKFRAPPVPVPKLPPIDIFSLPRMKCRDCGYEFFELLYCLGYASPFQSNNKNGESYKYGVYLCKKCGGKPITPGDYNLLMQEAQNKVLNDKEAVARILDADKNDPAYPIPPEEQGK